MEREYPKTFQASGLRVLMYVSDAWPGAVNADDLSWASLFLALALFEEFRSHAQSDNQDRRHEAIEDDGDQHVSPRRPVNTWQVTKTTVRLSWKHVCD